MTNAPETHVTSAANPAIKLARALIERRRARYREQAFMAEGERVLAVLRDSGLRPRILFIDAARRGELNEVTLTAMSDGAERILTVEPELYRLLSDTETPQPICAVVEMPLRARVHGASLALALDGVRDPGNVGTILRTAVAAGVDAVLLLPGTADPFGPKAVRASAGLVGVAPLVRQDALLDLPEELFAGAPEIILADADAEKLYTAVDWSAPICLVIGGETSGFAPATRAAATQRVRIPMRAPVESLNAGVAAAVVLFDAVRRRSAP